MNTSYHKKPRQSRPVTETVRAVDELHLWGPITPTAWRQHPIFRRKPSVAQQKRGESGTVNHCAIDVLADIVRWYRIKRTVDEQTGRVIAEERLFSGGALQKDYQQWADELGWTKRQVQDAVKLLHDSKVIKRRCETMMSSYGIHVGNAVFLEPCVEKVREISRPIVMEEIKDETDPLTRTRERVPAKKGEGARTDETGLPPKRETLSYSSQQKTQSKKQQHQVAPVVETAVHNEGAPSPTIPRDDVALSLALLLREKVSKTRAYELAQKYPHERIERQLRFLSHRDIKKSRVGTLINAIIDDWDDPTQTVAALKARGEQIEKERVQDQAREREAKEQATNVAISEAREQFMMQMTEEKRKALIRQTLVECAKHPNWKQTADWEPGIHWKPDDLPISQRGIYKKAQEALIDHQMKQEAVNENPHER